MAGAGAQSQRGFAGGEGEDDPEQQPACGDSEEARAEGRVKDDAAKGSAEISLRHTEDERGAGGDEEPAARSAEAVGE